MSKANSRQNLKAAIVYWKNCLGKGTPEQRALVVRTITELEARLSALG